MPELSYDERSRMVVLPAVRPALAAACAAADGSAARIQDRADRNAARRSWDADGRRGSSKDRAHQPAAQPADSRRAAARYAAGGLSPRPLNGGHADAGH